MILVIRPGFPCSRCYIESMAGKKLNPEGMKVKVDATKNEAEAPAAKKVAGKKRKPEEAEAVEADNVTANLANGVASEKKSKKTKKQGKEANEEDSKKIKKTKSSDVSSDSEVVEVAANGADSSEEEEDPRRLENFRLCPEVVSALKKKDITSLFPIQAETLNVVLNGSDLIARARTGQVCPRLRSPWAVIFHGLHKRVPQLRTIM